MRSSRTVWPLGIALAAGCAPVDAPPAPIGLDDLGARAETSPYQLVGDGVGFRFANPLKGTAAALDGDALVVSRAGARDVFTVRTRAIDGVALPGAAEVGDCTPDGRVDLWGACLRRLALQRPGATEWWQNGPAGFEHGYTIARGSGPTLQIDVAFDGVAVRTDPSGATLTAPSGDRWRYDHLVATDASGRELDARFEAMEGGVALVVDVADAEFPVTVDPLLDSASAFREPDRDSARAGAAVAGAGDVNGDRIADVIIGMPGWSDPGSAAGAVAVYLGTGDGGMVLPNPFLFEKGDLAGRQLGYAVAGAGDVNGDGLSDVVAGGSGVVRVWLGSASTMTALPAVSDPAPPSGFGMAVSGAGHVDGDSRSDIVVGAASYSVGASNRGAVYLLRGANLANAELVEFGATADFALGASVAGVGDVNGDGFDDFVSGVPTYTSGQGLVRYYLGKVSGGLSGSGFLFGSGAEAFGTSVAGAGDFNGDGFADVVVGAPNASQVALGAGAAYVFPGTNTGLGSAPFARFEPSLAGDSFGRSVDGGGDLNGDGLADIVIGAPHFGDGQADEGAFYAAFGSRSGGPWSSPRLVNQSDKGGAARGHAVAIVGDLDNDGLSDVAVGTPGWDGGNADEGRVDLFRGQAANPNRVLQAGTSTVGAGRTSVAVVGDMNGDGYDEFVVGVPGCDDGQTDEGCVRGYLGTLDSMEGSPSWKLGSDQPGARLGASVTAGDFDGDGDQDLAIGAPGYDGGQTDEGAVYLWTNNGSWPPNGFALREIDQPNSAFGGSVASAGDVDRDGYDDLLVGAPGCDLGGVDQGRVHLFRGGPAGLGAKAAYDFTWGQPGAQLGANVDAAGDVNGDGFADVLVSAPFWDESQPDEGRVAVYAGSAEGLGLTPLWVFDSGFAGLRAGGGWDAGTSTSDGDGLAGRIDIDQDGFSEIFVGMWRKGGASPNMGLVRRWRGSAIGPSPVTVNGDHAGSAADGWNGFALAGGDLNGDGFGDLVMGSPGPGAHAYDNLNGSPVGFPSGAGFGSPTASIGGEYASAVDVGDYNHDGCADILVAEPGANLVHLYAGCASDNGLMSPQRAGPRIGADQDRIGPAGRASPGLRVPEDGFEAGFRFARTPMGRQEMTVEVEVKPLGTRFDGQPDVATNRLDSGRLGALSMASAQPLPDDTAFHWRARVVYDPTRAGSDVVSRWYYGGASGDGSGTHIVTKCGPGDSDNDGVPDCLDQDHDNDGDLDRTDCDDANPTVFTLATELCDAIDQDCDGNVREAFLDTDADQLIDCIDPDDDGDGDLDGADCAPLDAAIHHGATEACDLVDQDCDDDLVDTFADTDADADPDCTDPDDDGDGDLDGADCAPLDEAVFTGATEACDLVDQDCDDDLVDGFVNTDGDLKPDCVDGDDDGDGFSDGEDCAPLDELVHPDAGELCDGIDQDCDGDLLEAFPDFDGDRLADCVDDDDDDDDDPDVTDCVDDDPAFHAGADEQCDRFDSDCDGLLDEGCDTAVPDTETDETDETDTSGVDTAATWVTGGGCGCGGRSALSLLWTAPLALLVRRRRRAVRVEAC